MSNWKFKETLQNIELKASIDTLSIASVFESQVHSTKTNYINNDVRVSSSAGKREYIYRLNPNKVFKDINGNNKLITSYSDFIKAMNQMVFEMGLSEYRYSRIDFNVDSYKNTYDELLKLNKCFLLLFLKDSDTNCYQSTHPLTLTKLTTRIQRPYFQIENYNKAVQEPDGNVLNRLEIRSLKLKMENENIIPNLIKLWQKRFKKALDKYDGLQIISNDCLYREWIKCKEKYTIIEFVKKHDDQIFTRNQLTELYDLLGHPNPSSGASSYCKRFKPAFFTTKDIKNYINIIEKAFQAFLKS